MTNLTATQAPAHCFGALYHQRWRIEEAFKRLTHRQRLKSVSGLSQHALLIDVAAKILAVVDNLASLLARAAHESAEAAPDRPCNLAYAQTLRQSIGPRLLVFVNEIATLVGAALAAIERTIERRKPQRSAPRNRPKVKPHPSATYKGWIAKFASLCSGDARHPRPLVFQAPNRPQYHHSPDSIRSQRLIASGPCRETSSGIRYVRSPIRIAALPSPSRPT
jgi:hypothetical protein